MWIRSETQADDGALSVALVADIDGRIAGHVAISPVSIECAPGWHGLGPVAVAPADQGHGVGSALVQAALAELRAAGSLGCVVLGEPGYYSRFGFDTVDGLAYPDAPPEYFMALAFGGTVPRGAVNYHPALSLADG